MKICTHSFLADLGKLDGWFGQERGVYLGNKYYHSIVIILLLSAICIVLGKVVD